MAKTIGRLNVIIGTNTTRFNKGMRRATKRTKAFGRTMARTSKRVLKLGGALTAVAGVGVGVLIKRSMTAMDLIGKTSDRLNIGTEALVGFRHAAGLAGVAVEKFDKGLAKMKVSIGEAATGTGEALDAFKEMQLDPGKLSLLGTKEQWFAVAKGLRSISNVSKRIAFSRDIYGRGGIEFLNMTKLTRKEMEGLMLETKAFGTALDRVSFKVIEDANDAMYRLKQPTIGVGYALANYVSPWITIVSNQLTTMATAGESMGMRVIGVFENMTLGALEFASTAGRATAAWTSMERMGAVGNLALGETSNKLGAFWGFFGKIARTLGGGFSIPAGIFGALERRLENVGYWYEDKAMEREKGLESYLDALGMPKKGEIRDAFKGLIDGINMWARQDAFVGLRSRKLEPPFGPGIPGALAAMAAGKGRGPRFGFATAKQLGLTGAMMKGIGPQGAGVLTGPNYPKKQLDKLDAIERLLQTLPRDLRRIMGMS